MKTTKLKITINLPLFKPIVSINSKQRNCCVLSSHLFRDHLSRARFFATSQSVGPASVKELQFRMLSRPNPPDI